LAEREALVLTYNDLFLLLGRLFAAGLMLMPLVRKPASFVSR
jgi:DHA2 family multidrug resistance protein